jgi:hypothetical protein
MSRASAVMTIFGSRHEMKRWNSRIVGPEFGRDESVYVFGLGI